MFLTQCAKSRIYDLRLSLTVFLTAASAESPSPFALSFAPIPRSASRPLRDCGRAPTLRSAWIRRRPLQGRGTPPKAYLPLFPTALRANSHLDRHGPLGSETGVGPCRSTPTILHGIQGM